MGCCSKPNNKWGFKKPNKCKKPPVSTTNHYKSCKSLPEEKHCIVNDNFYDNYYKKCNHYYITDHDHITDHYYEYNIYHYDKKTTHDEKHICEDIEEMEPNNNWPKNNESNCDCNPDNDYLENEDCDYCYECDCDYCKKYKNKSTF